jgi:hypothetical protein
LDIFEPTPSQAAVILRRRLKSSGVDIPLSLAQECFAQSRGYHDWNTLSAHIDPRASNQSKHGNVYGEATSEQYDAYPHELSNLPISRWVECFGACWPEPPYRAETEADRERLIPLWRERDFHESNTMEERLRVNLYLAMVATGILDDFHYFAGAVDIGSAHHKHSLQLVFQRRIGNRFSLNVCPALNWDGMEVEFVIYEFNDLMGDGHSGEGSHPPLVAGRSETLVELLSRAKDVAGKIESDFGGWMNVNKLMRVG